MKKYIVLLALALSFATTSKAQSDGYFSDWHDYRADEEDENNPNIGAPQNHGTETDNEGAPMGSGLFILTALGLGYAIVRKKDKE